MVLTFSVDCHAPNFFCGFTTLLDEKIEFHLVFVVLRQSRMDQRARQMAILTTEFIRISVMGTSIQSHFDEV